MAELPLSRDERDALVSLIERRADVLNLQQRQNLLERAGLDDFVGRLHMHATAKDFSQELVRELQEAGTLAGTDRPALCALLSPLREDVEGHEDDLALVERLLERCGGGPGTGPGRGPGSPYPGLRAFRETEAAIYFGRAAETEQLAAELEERRLVMVVGASGSGKSSLVAAGLVPRLIPNLSPVLGGGEEWVYARFTPGGRSEGPFHALAHALGPHLKRAGITPAQAAARLAADPASMAALAGSVLDGQPPSARLLLFIDQFEELFRLASDDDARALAQVVGCAAAEERILTVATVRSEFYGACIDLKPLDVLLRGGGTFPLAAPEPVSVQAMIERPARLVGLEVEDALVAKVQRDLGSEPANLVLLAYALSQLYDRERDTGRLSLAGYRQAFGEGGLREAIGRRAARVFEGLSAEAQAALPLVFRELVAIDEDREVPTRARAPKSVVTAHPGAAELVEVMTEQGLLVTDEQDGHPAVAVAHEALFTHWPALAEWIEERREALLLRRQAEREAKAWDRAGLPASYLWPHERLEVTRQALARLGIDREGMEQPAKDFLRPEAERLLAELEDIDLGHFRRAEIGDRLARIGDPRHGVGLRPDGLPVIAWCKVDGDPPNDEFMYQDGETRRLPTFFISKYPITYAQHRAFLDAPDGYPNQGWWREPVRLKKRQPEPGEQYRPISNHPAENVSWYDAVAFCRWLSSKLGYKVQLPTEEEWEKAARAADGRDFPWGEEWDPRRANTAESHLGRTTAVGMYLDGRSPCGALDMSGNVWEWTLTEYGSGRSDDLTHEQARVLRGGSWSYFPSYARASYRFNYLPLYRGRGSGFRVVASAPVL